MDDDEEEGAESSATEPRLLAFETEGWGGDDVEDVDEEDRGVPDAEREKDSCHAELRPLTVALRSPLTQTRSINGSKVAPEPPAPPSPLKKRMRFS